MNRAVFAKAVRDALMMGLLVGLGIFFLEMLIVIVMEDFTEEMQYLWLNKPFFQRFARMLLGEELGGVMSATGLVSIGLAHPLLFAVTWAFALVMCTRVTVAELEWGTADLLFALPIPRSRIYVSASIGWMLYGLPMILLMLAGVYAGERIAPLNEPLEFAALSKLAVNYLAFWLCVGCVTMAVASFCTRRGVAVGIVLAWLLISFLLNYLAQFSSLMERLSFVGLLHYYKPLPVIRTNAWPLSDIGFLLALAAVSWTIGLIRFNRRDIPAAS